MDMTKAALASLAVLVLMGCDAATDAVSDSIAETVSTDPAKRVASLLMQNDPSVCAEDVAIQTALGAANRNYVSYLQNDGDKIRVDTVSATAIDKDIHEITCSAVFYYRPSNDRELSQQFRYKLRPTLGDDGGNFVAEVPNGLGTLAIRSHMDRGKSLKRLMDDIAANTNRGEIGSRESSDFSDRDHATDWSPSEKKLIEQYSDLNSDCRGSYDPDVTETACSERDNPNSALKRELRAANICLGRESDESAAENEFHRCTADSFRF